MYCKDIQSCFNEIDLYSSGKPTGKALLVNTENYSVYQTIRAKLEADGSKECIYVSKRCPEYGLPNMDDIRSAIIGAGCQTLIGYSQAALLRSAGYVDEQVSLLLEMPVRDHAIVLLDHCEQFLKNHFDVHPDIEKRVILVGGSASTLPRIRLAKEAKDCIGYQPLPNMKQLFRFLENLTDDTIAARPEIAVTTDISPKVFENAVYSVSKVDSIYLGMRKKYTDIASGTEERFGTDQQWRYLAEPMREMHSMSAITCQMFGSTANLSSHIGEVYQENDPDKKWYLWLSLKVFGAKGNAYITKVMQSCTAAYNLVEHIYMDLLEIKFDAPDFRQCYNERKHQIKDLPENMALLDQYLVKTGIHGKNAVWYLTDRTEKEKLEFLRCLSVYDYSSEELLQITEFAFPEINLYLHQFTFDSSNTKLPASSTALWGALTNYFDRYKVQKLTNRIFPEHMTTVEEYAESRPYNMLQPRAAVVKQLDKSNCQPYFFDALGVEYLGYITEKCEKYGLIAEISIARCELPSITIKNKEFLQSFTQKVWDIKALDELKHHSQVINYEQCKYPVHLFNELDIIDSELRKIQACLTQDQFDRAILLSDHGASRLAVIHEQENQMLEMEEKGEHSGRCCAVAEDPHIPYASYWDGYSILANYDRFKGSRKANVEVHGGATLEEVIVPIIVLTKKPSNIEVRFVDTIVKLKGKDPASIVVFSNIPLHCPKLLVNGVFYEGVLEGDSRHARFIMPELKRSKIMTADLYDNNKKLASGMEFRVQKGDTVEKELFKKNKFTL